MKFNFDMSMVTEDGKVLGVFEGIREFEGIPTEGEKSQLFDDESNDLPVELRKYLQQSQVLENLILFDKPETDNIIGSCLFSFFYIPTITTKEIFISYLEQYYGLYFWDFQIVRQNNSPIKKEF